MDGDGVAAPCDLTEVERSEVATMYASLEVLTYYELLRVKREDSSVEISRRFKVQSLLWHPDAPRFRRRPLGAFEPLVRSIFLALVRAREVLMNPELRAAYDRQLERQSPPDRAAPSERRPRKVPPEVLEEAHRRAAARARARLRRLRDPYWLKALEAKRRSLEAEKLGDLETANREAQLAAAYARHRHDFQSRADEMKARAERARVEPMLIRARRLEVQTRWDEAFQVYDRILGIEPAHARALSRSAALCLQRGHPPAEAIRRALRATKVEPMDAEHFRVLARAYAAAGEQRAAAAAHRRADDLDPPGTTRTDRRLRAVNPARSRRREGVAAISLVRARVLGGKGGGT